mmetsp:Transcript_36016/g.89641  ORF Transcript_36016/g.89641 Transcript_36016/m.89641 type:complete len:126 (+) Transcript_36016:1324-1701(+)
MCRGALGKNVTRAGSSCTEARVLSQRRLRRRSLLGSSRNFDIDARQARLDVCMLLLAPLMLAGNCYSLLMLAGNFLQTVEAASPHVLCSTQQNKGQEYARRPSIRHTIVVGCLMPTRLIVSCAGW